MQPIWKPFSFNLGTAASVPYSVAINGNTVYSGVAHKLPDAAFCYLNINDIIGNYLFPSMFASGILEDSQVGQNNRSVTVAVTNGNTGDVLTETFVYDYSGMTTRPRGIVAPIADVLPYGVPFMVNTETGKSYEIVYSFDNDEYSAVISDIGDSFATQYNLDMGINSGLRAITLKENNAVIHRWELCGNLSEYSILYCNEFGAWEVLPLIRCKRSDEYERFKFNNNGTVKDYAVESKTRYSCITPYLTDKGAGNLHHLLSSPYVYLLHASKTNESEIPLTALRVTDTVCEYKTFIDNGGKLNQCSFVVEVCDNLIRR